jgi:diguanylate cyclase (GGDEF)-like protein
MNLFTLHVEHAVLLGLFTILTLINGRLHDGADGSWWFSAYTGSAFIGAMLVALGGHGVSEPVSIVLGMTFFHLAYLCLHGGLRAFFARHEGPGWGVAAQGAVLAAGIAGLVEYGILQPDQTRGVAFYSGIFALQAAMISAMVFARSRKGLTRPGKVMGVLVALFAVNNLVRAILTLHTGGPEDAMHLAMSLEITLLCTTVLHVGIMVGFVWMTAAVLHERLDLLASTDPLTGLLNRRALEAAAQREIELASRTRRPLTAVLIDLDRFKQINDAFGHGFGDKTLVSVARCMQHQMRRCDLLARVGGDEFAILLHDTSREEAMEIVERLRTSIEDLVVIDGESETRVCASFGVAEVDGGTANWPELVRKCDRAVYRVKSIGGNLAAAH